MQLSNDIDPGLGSDPYEYIISWAMEVHGEDSDEQTRQPPEDDGDWTRLSASGDSQASERSDNDSVEAIVDMYLDLQHKREEQDANSSYNQPGVWAKPFDDDEKEAMVGKFKKHEGKRSVCARARDRRKETRTRWRRRERKLRATATSLIPTKITGQPSRSERTRRTMTRKRR